MMNNYIKLASLVLLLGIAERSMAQTTHVIDMSTGRTATGIIAVCGQDDDWTVKTPTSSTYVPAFCGTATPQFYSTYPGHNNNVRWMVPKGHPLSPYLVCPSGEHQHATAITEGTFLYRMTFEFNPCEVQSITFNLPHIGGDNEITEIQLNGYPFPVSFGWNPLSNSAVINANAAPLVAGTNEIIVKLNNTEQYFGMEIQGNLTIVDNSPSSNVSIGYNNGTLTGTGDGNLDHLWEIFCAPNGNTGPYSLVQSFTTPSFSYTGTCDCYYVRHSATNDCGTVCTAQTICEADCDLDDCSIEIPSGLSVTHLNSQQSQFSWNPMSTAAYFILEITPNDPSCCGGDQMFITAPFTFVCSTNVEVIDFSQIMWPFGNGTGGGETSVRCFSWRVRAVCQDGSMSNYSPKMCSSPGGGDPWLRPNGNGGSAFDDRQTNPESLQNANGDDNGMSTSLIYPNPASESVTLQIQNAGAEPLTIQLENISGNVVKTVRGVKPEDGFVSKNIRVDGLAKGTYVIRAYSKNREVMSDRLVVE